jgi:hypothetical protein
MRRHLTILFTFLFIFMFSFFIKTNAQLSYTGFEGLADESVFSQASWTAQGFTVPWVNGFDSNRGHIDNAYAKEGTTSLRITYPAGKYGPVTTGSGAQALLLVTPANQYYMTYWVRFSNNFSWGDTKEGGKLPGLGGGARCSGCITCTGSNGFTARLMWRTGGKLVLYLYHIEADKIKPPCGDNITLQQNGSDYYITKGQWFQITERVKVNTGSNHDGEVELWINEQPALLVTGIEFVTNGDKVDNLYFSTFHGGNDAAWAPISDSYTWFDEIKISTNPADIFSPLGLIALKRQKNGGKVSSREEVVVSPEPVKSGKAFLLDLSFKEEKNYQLQWTDASGHIIRSEEVNIEAGPLIAPELTRGLYILKIIFTDEVITRKIMVE